MVRYPAFLNKQPLIFGIGLTDIFKLTGLIFVGSLLDLSQELVLGIVAFVYFSMISIRKIYPRKHLEFYLKKKSVLHYFNAIKRASK